MNDPVSPAPSPVPPPGTASPEITLKETINAALTDLADLAAALPGDTVANARIAGRIAGEMAEAAARLACLPARPPALPGHDHLALQAFRSAVAAGEDVGAVIALGLARLAAELGSSAAVVANQPASWEAACVASLLAGMVGAADEHLATYGVQW